MSQLVYCHFFALAARPMRHVLVDEARRQNRRKRGGACIRVELDDHLPAARAQKTSVIELDEALTKLSRRDARKSKIVELRYFVGLEVKEIAEVLEVSEETVLRDWRLAKAWLRRELERPSPR